MQFDYSDEQQMLHDSVTRFAQDRYSLPQLRRYQQSEMGYSAENWQFYAEQGWLALPFAEAQGGLGGTVEDLCVLLLALGRAHAMEPYVSTVLLCGGILAALGREDLVAQILSGELTLAFAHSAEARPGDLAEAAGCQVSETGGLTGEKRLVPHAGSAALLLVTATGPELLLLEPQQSGISRDSYPLLDGSRAADLRFDLETLPSTARLAQGARAATAIAEAIDSALLANLALAVGAIEAALAETGRYLAEREQFGRPIGKFQALQHILADMFVDAQDSRSALYRALAQWQAGSQTRAKALSSAKVMIDRCGERVSRAAIQLHGGYGMTEEFAVGHHYRRLCVLQKQWGDTDYHRARLAGVLGC